MKPNERVCVYWVFAPESFPKKHPTQTQAHTHKLPIFLACSRIFENGVCVCAACTSFKFHSNRIWLRCLRLVFSSRLFFRRHKQFSVKVSYVCSLLWRYSQLFLNTLPPRWMRFSFFFCCSRVCILYLRKTSRRTHTTKPIYHINTSNGQKEAMRKLANKIPKLRVRTQTQT